MHRCVCCTYRTMWEILLYSCCVPFPESDQEHSYRGGQHRQGSVQRDRVSSVGQSLSGELLWPQSSLDPYIKEFFFYLCSIFCNLTNIQWCRRPFIHSSPCSTLRAVDLSLLSSFLQQLDPPEEEQLSGALQSVELEMGKLGEIPWLYHILQPNDEEVGSRVKHRHRHGHGHIVPYDGSVK